MIYAFLILAFAAFIGFALQSVRRNGHGMVYSAIVCLGWLATAIWWGGLL